MKFLSRKSKKRQNTKNCGEKIKKANSSFRDYLKTMKEEAEAELQKNGSWLPKEKSEGEVDANNIT